MCLRGLSEKKKLLTQKVKALHTGPHSTVFGAGITDFKTLSEYDQTKSVRAWPIEG